MSPTLRGEYAKIAAAHARAQEDKLRLPLTAARANALKLDWSGPIRRRSRASSARRCSTIIRSRS